MTTRELLDTCLWPLPRLHEGVELLCAVFADRRDSTPTVPSVSSQAARDAHLLGRDLDRIASPFDLEFEPIEVEYAAATHLGGPLVVAVPADSKEAPPPGYLVIRGDVRAGVLVLTTAGTWRAVPRVVVAEAVRAPMLGGDAREVGAIVDRFVPGRRRARARDAMLQSFFGDRRLTDAWLLQHDPGGPFAAQVTQARVPRAVVGLVALHAIQVALWMLAWTVVGRSALGGQTSTGWWMAWGLLLLTIVPLQTRSAWLQGSITLTIGRLLKERLLTGALRLEPDEVRQHGAGRHLGRVIESDAIETLALSGGLMALLAAVELLGAGLAFTGGVAPVVQTLLLLTFTALVIVTALAYHARRRRWTDWRLAMTHEFVERLTGHRTRLAQEEPERWHADEDRAIDEYVVRSHALDRLAPWLQTLAPRLWVLLSLAVIMPAFVGGAAPAPLAISVGAVLLATLALRRFADGLSQISGATAAWTEAQPLFAAATRRPHIPAIAEPAAAADGTRPRAKTLELRDIGFRYPSRPKPVLAGVDLVADAGDRLLLQGRSGGGKSTLASMIAGLRTPDSGLVLVQGLDRRTLGDHAWRRRTVAVPQFHENHVFAETFAFNLLMGRRWPPKQSDLDLAEQIAGELGLAGLIARMPAGLLQLVGESGWQLSHGERSRLFMARALLQESDLLILDESFAALDPETLRDCLHCVLRRAPTLLVVAHP